MITFICYDRCSTCQKAERWLQEQKIPYVKRPIKEAHPSAEELASWSEKSGLPLKRFFNTSGLLYKQYGLKDKLPSMEREEMLTLLSSDGMLVKRPLLLTDTTVLVGFRADEWEKALSEA